MNLSEKLIQLGFSKNKAAVYVALVEIGQCKASEIIKKTGLHRNIVYEALDEMVLDKLAFKTSKGGVALFQLSDATTLVDTAKQQLAVAQDVTKQINAARDQSPNEIKLYEGFEGFKAYHESVLNELKDYQGDNELLILASAQATDAFYNSFFSKFDAKREVLNVSGRLLTTQQEFVDLLNQNTVTEARLLPGGIADPVETKIWTDHVSFLLKDIDPFVISIKNKKLANAFRDYFEMLWNQDVQVFRGLEGIKAVMEQSLQHRDNWFIGGNGGFARAFPDYWEDYNARRIAAKTQWHDLVDQDTYLPGLQVLPPGVHDAERCYEFRWLPSQVSSPSVIFFYGTTVATILWDAQPEPIAFVMNNPDVVAGYKKYFDYLWGQDTQVVNGLTAVQNLFYAKARAMKQGEEYCVLWGTYGEETQAEMQPWFITYNTERIQRGLHLNLIMFEVDRATVIDEMSQAGDPQLTQTHLRFINQANYGSPMQINIYPDSVVLFYWGVGENAMAVEISKMEIRDAMRAYFDGVWATAKE